MKNVLIVDDHQIIFTGLEAELKNIFSLFFASNSNEALKIVHENNIDSAILDITLGNENGMDLAFDIKKSVPQIIFFSMHKSVGIIDKVRHDGYAGFFLKDEPIDLMIKTLNNPNPGHFYMTDSVKAIFKNQNFEGDENYERLTPREQQIFRMIAEGKTPKVISSQINISTKTISVHRENLLRKMGIKTNTEIVHLAIKLEIIQL